MKDYNLLTTDDNMVKSLMYLKMSAENLGIEITTISLTDTDNNNIEIKLPEINKESKLNKAMKK